jgi:hypothetical protein
VSTVNKSLNYFFKQKEKQMKKILKIALIPLTVVTMLTGCQAMEDRENIENTIKEETTKQEDIEGTVISKKSTDEYTASEDKKDEQKTN